MSDNKQPPPRVLQKDQGVWKERPLRPRFLDGAVKNARYLRQLRRVMMEWMLQRFTAGVNVYLSTVRNNAVLTNVEVNTVIKPPLLVKPLLETIPRHFAGIVGEKSN